MLSNAANEGESVKAESKHDVHIDMGDLIRDNSEGLWPGANTLAHTILNVENIIPRRQRDPIISPFVGCDARDFFVVRCPCWHATQNTISLTSRLKLE